MLPLLSRQLSHRFVLGECQFQHRWSGWKLGVSLTTEQRPEESWTAVKDTPSPPFGLLSIFYLLFLVRVCLPASTVSSHTAPSPSLMVRWRLSFSLHSEFEGGRSRVTAMAKRTGNSRGWHYAARHVTSRPRHTLPSQLLYWSSDLHRLPVAFTRTKFESDG